MELFHEYRNKCLNALIQLAERIANGEVMKKSTLEEEYYRLADDSKRTSAIFFENVLSDVKCPLFDIRDNNHVKLVLPVAEPIAIANLPILTEKIWLHAALHDRFTKLFFSEEEQEALKKTVAQMPVYNTCIDDNWRNDLNLNEKSFENVPVILAAIHGKHPISFQYKGKPYIGLPIKLEYDERQCKIFAVVLSDTFRLKVDTAELLEIHVDENSRCTVPDSLDKMRDQKVERKPVVFVVTDEHHHNAIERAMLAFSVYDHEVEKLSENQARFKIWYYTRNLDLLFKEILAFGPDIQIEKPQLVRNKMIAFLKKL